MEIVQKRYSTRVSFAFGDSELRYVVKDAGGSHTFSLPYASIPGDLDEIVERNAWFRNAGIFWVALGVLQVALTWQQGRGLRGSLWLSLGVACLVAYVLRKTTYSIITTPKGRILVIRDRLHDRVMSEIVERRRGQWRDWYATVDLANDPAREIAKFDWLKEREAITDAEHHLAVAEIESRHRAAAPFDVFPPATSDRPH